MSTDILDYGEPAQYVLTASSSAVRLYRRRVGEEQGMVVDSETSKAPDFGEVGASQSFFTIGRTPPDGNWSQCEIEQCVIWGRELNSTELQQINSDPYFTPGQ